jgi:hypothetical protein
MKKRGRLTTNFTNKEEEFLTAESEPSGSAEPAEKNAQSPFLIPLSVVCVVRPVRGSPIPLSVSVQSSVVKYFLFLPLFK